MLNLLFAGIQAYLLGSITFGLIVPRFMGSSRDIRKEGSGNVGATNVLRTQGKLQGGLVLAGDLLKGALASWIGLRLAGAVGGGLAGACAVLGHCYPLYFGFRGGKSVATAAGAVLILLPQAMPILLAVFLLTTAAGKMVSLGSILGAASLIPCLFLFHPPSPIMAFSCFAVAMIVWKHQGNIKRVLAGTENKLILRKK